jgi:hypothetical protein
MNLYDRLELNILTCSVCIFFRFRLSFSTECSKRISGVVRALKSDNLNYDGAYRGGTQRPSQTTLQLPNRT